MLTPVCPNPSSPFFLSFSSEARNSCSSTAMATTAPNADDILGQHRFVTPTGAPAASGPSSSPYAPTASSILAGTSLDAAALHPLAGVVDNKELDYLLLEDDKLSSVAGGKTVLPSRGWGDELCYGTGSTYLAGQFILSRSQCPRRNPLITNRAFPPPAPGLGLGGAWGFVEGFRRPIAAARQAPAVAPAAAAAAGTTTGAAPTAQAIGAQATAFAKEAAPAAAASTTEGAAAAAARPGAGAGAAAAQRVSARLRWNNVLNQVTRRGTSMGNSAGVLGETTRTFLPFYLSRSRGCVSAD